MKFSKYITCCVRGFPTVAGQPLLLWFSAERIVRTIAVAIRFNHHRTCSHEKIRSHTVYIHLSTQSTLDEVGSPSAAKGRSPNAAQCKGNNWADNFQWGSERYKTLVSHAPFILPDYCPLSLSLSESLLFLSDQDKYKQENIQNRLVKKSYKLREDSDQTVRMRMLIWIFAGHTHVPHLICRALGHI